MTTAWRQGDLLAPADAVALNVVGSGQGDTHRALVISHSCDIACTSDVEPTVELLVGVVIQSNEATAHNGHSIRKLHLGAKGPLATEWVQYGIGERRELPLSKLLKHQPWTERRYNSEQRAVLRRWLAQRYARSEFPDAFINWLKLSGVGSGFEKFGKRYSAQLVGIYFDFDDDSERDNPDDPYALGVSLVYDAGDADNADVAEKAGAQLKALFSERCKSNGQWQWIELTYCEAFSEEVFSLRAARTFRRWRFEHRSLGGEPLDSSE